MNDNSFVKIENKELPINDIDDSLFDYKKKSNAGFINFIFLFNLATTLFMWIMLIFYRK